MCARVHVRPAPGGGGTAQPGRRALSLHLQVHAEAPSRDLYNFSAKVTVGDMAKSENVSVDSLLLRGCKIRNCADVYGLVVYTGVDTKIVLNSGTTPLKRTRLERLMNGQVRRQGHSGARARARASDGYPRLTALPRATLLPPLRPSSPRRRGCTRLCRFS